MKKLLLLTLVLLLGIAAWSSSQTDPLLLRPCDWFPGKLHVAGQEFKFLLQVRTRVSRLRSSSGTQHRFRGIVDVGIPQGPARQALSSFSQARRCGRSACKAARCSPEAKLRCRENWQHAPC